MILGEKIKKLRKEKKVSNTELSEALNWPISKVSKIESGSQKITVDELTDICRVLAVDPATLIKDDFESRKFQGTIVDDDLRETLRLAATLYPIT